MTPLCLSKTMTNLAFSIATFLDANVIGNPRMTLPTMGFQKPVKAPMLILLTSNRFQMIRVYAGALPTKMIPFFACSSNQKRIRTYDPFSDSETAIASFVNSANPYPTIVGTAGINQAPKANACWNTDILTGHREPHLSGVMARAGDTAPCLSILHRNGVPLP